MKFTAIFAAAVAVLAGSVVAQPETPEQCRARCNQFYVDCIANGGTETFCRGLAGMSTLSQLYISPDSLFLLDSRNGS